METLAKRLKESRIENGLTQDELAEKAKLKNQSIIGSLESGYRKNSSYIPQIAEALGLNALWLSNGTGEKYKNRDSCQDGAKTYVITDPKVQAIIESILALHGVTANQTLNAVAEDKELPHRKKKISNPKRSNSNY